jgi:hypothetical protein
MTYKRKLLLALAAGLLSLISAPAIVAQAATCPAIVQAAVASTLLECEDVAAGQVCYGNAFVSIESDHPIRFERRGDRALVSGLVSLQSNPMSLDRGEWGMALMQVVANRPNEIMTYVVIGDVLLENTSDTREPVLLVDVRVRHPTGANVRQRPAEDAPLVRALRSGDFLPATGILADESWLRLALPDGETGWVRRDLVTVLGDRDTLEVVTPRSAPPQVFYSPMQAFDFQSGVYAAFCAAAPDSGILVQSANRSGVIPLLVNGVDLRFEGTLFLQTDEANAFVINVLEGAVTLRLDESAASAEAGQRLRLPWDAANTAYAAPAPPEDYRYLRIRTLPLELLPRPVTRLSENLIGVVTPPPRSGSPLDGISSESACTIAATEEVRLRLGPGRDYPISGRLLTDESARPEARAQGTDGALWWQLYAGLWVRSDVVRAAGACGDLPLVAPPPLPSGG